MRFPEEVDSLLPRLFPRDNWWPHIRHATFFSLHTVRLIFLSLVIIIRYAEQSIVPRRCSFTVQLHVNPIHDSRPELERRPSFASHMMRRGIKSASMQIKTDKSRCGWGRGKCVKWCLGGFNIINTQTHLEFNDNKSPNIRLNSCHRPKSAERKCKLMF